MPLCGVGCSTILDLVSDAYFDCEFETYTIAADSTYMYYVPHADAGGSLGTLPEYRLRPSGFSFSGRMPDRRPPEAQVSNKLL